MALRIRRVKRALGIGKAKTDKYLIVPDRATVVSFEHLCDQVAATIGMNKAIVRAVLSGVVNGMITFIRQGHAVNLEHFGTFLPSIRTKSSSVESEANVDSIKEIRLNFRPCAELREVIKNIEFEFDITDSTNDEKEVEMEEPDDEAEEAVPNP